MKPYLAILGHTVIVVLCGLVAMVLNGMFVRTAYTVDGMDITRLSTAAAAEKLRTSKLVATTHIGPWVEVQLPGPEMQALVFPATAGLLLLIVYMPGLIWPAAKHLPTRLGIAAVLFVAMFVVLQYGGAYRA